MNIEQRLQQIKDDVARESVYKNFDELYTFRTAYEEELNTIALRLAKEMCDLQKESDAKAARVTWDRGHKCIESAYVDREAILNNPNVCNQ